MRALAVPEVFVRGDAVVGEGPVVDARTDELVWVDIPSGALHRASLAQPAATHRFDSIGMNLGAVAPSAAGGYVAAVRDGLGTIDDDGTFRLVHELLPQPDMRMNDAACDSSGRFWVGSTAMDFAPGRGALHCWDGADVRTVRTGFALPNGIGWSPDDRTMYFIDSMAHVVLRADFDPGDGVLGQLSTFLGIGSGPVVPDGLCVDDDGHVWVAVWGDSELRRFDPTGRQVATVPLPVSQPTSCTFGADGTLYITTAAEGVSEPLAGSVFALATDHRGVPAAPANCTSPLTH